MTAADSPYPIQRGTEPVMGTGWEEQVLAPAAGLVADTELPDSFQLIEFTVGGMVTVKNSGLWGGWLARKVVNWP